MSDADADDDETDDTGVVETDGPVEGDPDDVLGGEDGATTTATAADGGDGPDTDHAPDTIGVVEARKRAIAIARDDLEYDVDGVVKVSSTDGGGWRVLVEVVEREAVPDTNDILGRYELKLSPTGTLEEFGLVERYRRDELREEL
jgi:hypothetical protein